MYRVSREGRRASNGSTDTPPRTLRQRISKLHAYVPTTGSKDKPYLQDPCIRLGLKIAGALFALIAIRQIHHNMCYARYDSAVQHELSEVQARLAETETRLKKEHLLYLGLENELSVSKMEQQTTERDGSDLIKVRSALDEKVHSLLVANQELENLRQQNDDLINKIAALEAGAPQQRMVLTALERNSDGGGPEGDKTGDAHVIPPVLKVPSSDDGVPENNGEGGLSIQVSGEHPANATSEEISGKYNANKKSYRFGKHANENMSEVGLSRNRLSPSHWIMRSSFTSDAEAQGSSEQDRSRHGDERAPRGIGVAGEKDLYELNGSKANGVGGSAGEAGGSQDSYLTASSGEEEEEDEGRFRSDGDMQGNNHPDSKWPSPDPGEARKKAWGNGAGKRDSATEDFKVIAMRSGEAEVDAEAVEPVKSAAGEGAGTKSVDASKKSNLRGKVMDIIKKKDVSDASDASDATKFYAVELEDHSASQDKPLPVVTNVDVSVPDGDARGVGGEVGRDPSEGYPERIKDLPEKQSAEDLQEWFDREMKKLEESQKDNRIRDGGDGDKSPPSELKKTKKFTKNDPKEEQEEAKRPMGGNGSKAGVEKLGDDTRETGIRSVAGEPGTASRDGDLAEGEAHAALGPNANKGETHFGKKAEKQHGEKKPGKKEQAEREQSERERAEREQAEREQAEREQAERERVKEERTELKRAKVEETARAQGAKEDGPSRRSSEPDDEAEAISMLKEAMEKEDQVQDASESSLTETEQDVSTYDPKFAKSSSEESTMSKGEDEEEASEEDDGTEDEDDDESLSSRSEVGSASERVHASSGESSEKNTGHDDPDQSESSESSESPESSESSESSTSSREKRRRSGGHGGKRQDDSFSTDDLTSSESALVEDPPRAYMEIPKDLQKKRDAMTSKHMAVLRGAPSRHQ